MYIHIYIEREMYMHVHVKQTPIHYAKSEIACCCCPRSADCQLISIAIVSIASPLIHVQQGNKG